jgi:hypothetical protein
MKAKEGRPTMPAKPTATPGIVFRWHTAGTSLEHPALILDLEDSGGTLGTSTRFVSNWDPTELRATISSHPDVVIRGHVAQLHPGKVEIVMWRDHNDKLPGFKIKKGGSISPATLTITLTNDPTYPELPDFPNPVPPATPTTENPPSDTSLTTTLPPIEIDLVS